MKRFLSHSIAALLALIITLPAFAGKPKRLVDNTVKEPEEMQFVIKGDTVSDIIKEKNYGRYDRGLRNYLIIPRGQWSFGATASFGNVNTNDIEFLSYLNDFDLSVRSYSVKPYASYFFRNNSSLGMRFGFTRTYLDLNSLNVDFDDDMNFSLRDISYHNEALSASIFYRNYIGLDRSRRFAVFNEVALNFSSGDGTFARPIGGVLRTTATHSYDFQLNFSPGFAVFLHEMVSFNLSFGVFSWYYKHESQKTTSEGSDVIEYGTHGNSGANFKFNLLNLNMGIAVHI